MRIEANRSSLLGSYPSSRTTESSFRNAPKGNMVSSNDLP